MNSTELVTRSEINSFRIERKFIQKWILHNFCCEKVCDSELLPSTTIRFQFSDNLKFSGKLYLTGRTCAERYFKLRLGPESGGSEFKLHVKLWGVDEKNAQNVGKYINTSITVGLCLYDANSTPKCLLSLHKHTLMCEITYVYYGNKISPRKFPIKESKLKHDLADLFKNKKYWDVTMVVAGHDIHAHKGVLASRSKVFAAMFENDMEEAKSNKVVINDIALEVFQEMLRYIYTDEVLNINQIVPELLAVSDKYDLPKLKSICENRLANNISIETAVDTLNLADLNRAQKLKDHAVNFIKFNIKAVMNTEGWKTIACNMCDLLAEIFSNMY